jgi:hypothetical protein
MHALRRLEKVASKLTRPTFGGEKKPTREYAMLKIRRVWRKGEEEAMHWTKRFLFLLDRHGCRGFLWVSEIDRVSEKLVREEARLERRAMRLELGIGKSEGWAPKLILNMPLVLVKGRKDMRIL